MKFCPKLDIDFCDLLFSAGENLSGFKDVFLGEYKPTQTFQDVLEIHDKAFALLDEAQKMDLDARYIRRITSFCRWIKMYVGENHAFADSMHQCLGLNANLGEVRPFTHTELWNQKCLADELAQGLGMESVGDYINEEVMFYGEEGLLDRDNLVPFCYEVKHAHLAAMAEMLGSIPDFNYEINWAEQPRAHWKCWLSGNGAAFTHAFNAAKPPYCDKKIPKGIIVNSICHEVTHAVDLAGRSQDIQEKKRPQSDRFTWSTDPSQFAAEGIAYTSPLYFKTEFTNNPAVILNCPYFLLLDMVRNNVQMYNAAGARFPEVAHFVNSFVEGIFSASSTTVRDRNQRGPIHQISPFLYALAHYMFADVHRRGSAQDKKDLLRMTFHEPCTYEHLRQRFGPWHSPHCMAPDTDLAF